MIQKTIVPIQFQGLDQKTDENQLVPGTFAVLENVSFKKTGLLSTRNGFVKLPNDIDGGSFMASGKGLATFNDELISFDNTKCYSYSPGIQKWVDKGTTTSCISKTTTILTNSYQQSNIDVASYNGVECYVYNDTRGGIRYSIFDSNTNTFLVNDASLSSTASYGRVAAFRGKFILASIESSTRTLEYRTVNVNNPSSISGASTVENTVYPDFYKFDLIALKDYVAFCYLGSSGGFRDWSYKRLDQAFTLGSRIGFGDPGYAVDGIACYPTLEDNKFYACYMAYNATYKTYVLRINANGAGNTATNYGNIAHGAAFGTMALVETVNDGSTATLEWYLTFTAADTKNYYVTKNIYSGFSVTSTSVSIGAATTTTLARSVSVCGNAFQYNSTTYIPVLHQSTLQSQSLLLNSSGNIISRSNYGTAGAHQGRIAVSKTLNTSTGKYVLGAQQRGRILSEDNEIFTLNNTARLQFDFTSENTYGTKQLNETLFLSGGLLQSYDGNQFYEHNFVLYPEDVTVASGAAGSIAAGTYLYVVCYEWTDQKGRIYRSAPSIPKSITFGGANNSTDVVVPTLRLTRKSKVRIVVYRTEAGGSDFYRVTSISSPTFNDTTVDAVTFNDSLADASINTNDLLYTTGDVLEHFSPPSSTILSTYRNRIFLSAASEPNTIYFSKKYDSGTPVEFSESLKLNLEGSGDITGLQQLDNTLIIFKSNKILAISGDGPNNIGAQSDFQIPTVVSSDTGCINPNTIVLTNTGIMFLSEKGIYQLDRSLNVSYIGAQVEDSVFSDTITAGNLIAKQNEVRFSTLGGNTLVFNYLYNKWSIHRIQQAADAVVYNDTLSYITSSGRVYSESESIFSDDGAFIPMKLETGWLAFAGIQGFQRVYRLLFLGKYRNDHNIRVAFKYDYFDSEGQSETITASTLSGPGIAYDSGLYDAGAYGGITAEYRARVRLDRQKCTAVKIVFETANNGTIGESVSLSNFSFEVGVKKGASKLIQSKTY